MGLSKELSCEAGVFSCCCNPHRFFQSECLRLYFPLLEPWVAQSVSLPSCSSQYICMQMWDYWSIALSSLVCQLLSCQESSPPWLLASAPPTGLDECFLTPWLSVFHTVQFSVSSCYFLFLSLWLSFFLLCKEAKYIYLCLHLGWKSPISEIFHMPNVATTLPMP